jgi:hypothetical protein
VTGYVIGTHRLKRPSHFAEDFPHCGEDFPDESQLFGSVIQGFLFLHRPPLPKKIHIKMKVYSNGLVKSDRSTPPVTVSTGGAHSGGVSWDDGGVGDGTIVGRVFTEHTTDEHYSSEIA